MVLTNLAIDLFKETQCAESSNLVGRQVDGNVVHITLQQLDLCKQREEWKKEGRQVNQSQAQVLAAALFPLERETYLCIDHCQISYGSTRMLLTEYVLHLLEPGNVLAPLLVLAAIAVLFIVVDKDANVNVPVWQVGLESHRSEQKGLK